MQTKKTQLKILIAGAGLGGLAAAFRLALDGHDVELFEKRPTFVAKGGGIMIRPNASRFLFQWGLETELDAISDRSTATSYRNGLDNDLLMKRQPVTAGDSPDLGCSREDTQAILYRRALEAGAKIRFGLSIIDVSDGERSATAKLDNGETVTADIVLAADGVLSQLRPKILGEAVKPNIGWSCLHQTRLEENELLSDADARKLADTDDLQVYMVRGGGGYLVGRYSRKLRRYSAAFGVPEVDENNPRLWDEHGDIDAVRNYFKDFDPSIRAVLKLAKSCDRWRLAEMPDLPRWTSWHGRLVLLGDSAHAMFPDAAQGFSQIVEDIAALSYVLSTHDKNKIGDATNIWQQVRIPRVNRIKAWARSNQSLYTKGAGSSPRGAKQQTAEEVSLVNVKPDMNADFRSAPFVRWAFGCDAVDEVRKFVEDQGTSAKL